MKKTNISVQTIFYIFMGIVFVSLMFFGYQKITELGDVLSKQEILEIEEKLENIFKYCNEPLNQGSGRKEEIRSDKFNYICIFEEDLPSDEQNEQEDTKLRQEINTLKSGGHNVGLFKLKITSDGRLDKNDFITINSFSVNLSKNFDKCFPENDDSNSIIVNIKC